MFGLGHLQLRQSFNTRLTMAVLLIAISQFNFGFDQQGFATTQAMDAFDRQFGMYDSKKDVWYLPTTWLAFFNGFNYIGQAFGEANESLHSLSTDRSRRCPPWFLGQ